MPPTSTPSPDSDHDPEHEHDLERGLPRTDSTSYIQFTPKRAMASFENLVALANHQERLREARRMVWRDRGEPAVELRDLWECAEHAGRGGMRAATLGFSIRACVNIVLALIRIKRVPKNLRFRLLYTAIFGSSSFQFATMMGSFVSLYKFILNALPILLPNHPHPLRSTLRYINPRYASTFEDDLDLDLPAEPPAPLTAQRGPRLSLSAQAQQIWVRKRTSRWHAVVAGAVAGGVSIMFEARSRRTVISQQLFVRGLQGSWNAFSTKRGITIPYGDVAVFAICSGQILYGFLLRPDTLPPSYNAWVGQAAKAPPEAVHMNMTLVRDGTFDPKDIEAVLDRSDVTSANRLELLERLADAVAPIPAYGDRYAPCAAVHPMITHCTHVPLIRFFDVFKWMLPIYGALHFVPTVLFKRKQFVRAPGRMLLRAGWGTTRSSAFLGVFVIIYQTFFCYKHWLHHVLVRRGAPRGVADLLISKPTFWLLGFMSGFSLFVEERRRRGELAMYVLPKGLESVWIMLRGKGLVFKTGQYGDAILTAIGMGMVMSTYQNDPQHLSGLVRRILYQFIGPN